MNDVSVTTPEALLLRDSQPDVSTVGLLVSLTGAMGVVAPAIINCALLAAEEASRRYGRRIELVLFDSSGAPGAVASAVGAALRSGKLHGLLGTHTSDVRMNVEREIRGEVPYIFTPPHEMIAGAEATMFLGADPAEQIRGPLLRLAAREGTKRWALVGNDYVWPRSVHAVARRILPDYGGEVVSERLVPIGSVDAGKLVAEALSSGADAVLVSLIGRDGINFHRVFNEIGADRYLARLCTALDEACLLAVGGDNGGRLFSAMPSFVLQDDEQHNHLIRAYAERYGEPAPMPGAYAEGSYDGMHLLARLLFDRSRAVAGPVVASEIRLARADGFSLEPLHF